ncbi:MAG: DUF1801 domain-containing protein [Rhodobacteraceae bacterium]|nr:DUF1801 domain-containing protein [Paracoccaceae bacterium]
MAKARPTVDLYIAERSPEVRALLEDLRAMVRAILPGAEEGMKWGAPVWTVAGQPQVYLYGGKDHAHLGFVHGARLDDPEGVLKGKGKDGRHVQLWPGQPMPDAVLKALIRQCGTGPKP